MSDSSPVEDAQADQALVAADNRSFPRHWIVLGLLVIANAAFGAYFNPTGKTSNEVGEKTAFILTGFLFTQPFLFALWAAFAPHRFYRRFLWALLLCSLVAFAEELGTLGYRNPGLGFEMVVELILFTLFTLVLLLVRRFFGWRFNLSQTEFMPSDYLANQFGIKHLILLTTITGIAFALIRSLFIFNSYNRYMPSVVSVLFAIGLFSAMIIPIMIVPWFTMTFRGNLIKLITLAIVLLGIIDSLIFLIVQQPFAAKYFSVSDILQCILLMQLGGCLTVLLNTIVLRLCGYRLIRERKTVSSSQALG